MKELKFRAWHNEVKKYYEVEAIDFMTEEIMYIYGDHYHEEQTKEWFAFEDIIFEQYTGLKDKNGVEIYEGDIIKNKLNKPTIVYYEEGSYKAKIQNNVNRSTIYNLGHLLEKWQFKVIGNIHENIDLLGEKHV